MQEVLVGVVLDLAIIIMILLLFSLIRRFDLLEFQMKDALRRLDALERRSKEPPDSPTTGRQRAVNS